MAMGGIGRIVYTIGFLILFLTIRFGGSFEEASAGFSSFMFATATC